MDLVDLIIAPLDVRAAFPNTPWLLFEAVWRRLGLPFDNFNPKYIHTRKYTVRTVAGLTPILEPFLYLLVTLPLPLIIQEYCPAYAPYPLLSPLVGIADHTNLTVAHTLHEPQTPDDGPTVTHQADDLLEVTISYLSLDNLIVHPTKSVAMIEGAATGPILGSQGASMNIVEATAHFGSDPDLRPQQDHPPLIIAVLPGPPPTIYVPGHQSPLPVQPKLCVLLEGGLDRLHRLRGTPPNTPLDRPPTGHTRSHQGVGGTGLARLHITPEPSVRRGPTMETPYRAR